MTKNRGFTLIELLVVISIIGLMSSIVLASVNTARDKAAEAAARSEMYEISQAIYYAKLINNETLIQITGSSWSAGGCSTGLPATTLPSPDLRGNTNPNCYGQWVNDLAAIQAADGGTFGDLSKFDRDPWGSPFLLDENEGQQHLSLPCGEDTITTAGPNGIWEAWTNTPGIDDIIVSIPNGTINAGCPGG